jgi:hypothetical protein
MAELLGDERGTFPRKRFVKRRTSRFRGNAAATAWSLALLVQSAQHGGGLSARNWVPQALAKAVRAAKIWHLPNAAAAGLRRVWYVTAIACPAESGAFVVQAGPRRYTAVTFRGDARQQKGGTRGDGTDAVA